MAFYDFHIYGGMIFIPHPRKQCLDYVIDLEFGTNNYWHKTINSAKFQKFAVYF